MPVVKSMCHVVLSSLVASCIWYSEKKLPVVYDLITENILQTWRSQFLYVGSKLALTDWRNGLVIAPSRGNHLYNIEYVS